MQSIRFKIKFGFIISSLVSFMRIFTYKPISISPVPFFILGSGRNDSSLLVKI
jgi:hypothetical protein